MILYESLRLYPPLGTLSRQPNEDTVLGDLSLPAGVLLSLPVFVETAKGFETLSRMSNAKVDEMDHFENILFAAYGKFKRSIIELLHFKSTVSVHYGYLDKLVLSSSPSKANCMVTAICGINRNYLAYCKHGNESWECIVKGYGVDNATDDVGDEGWTVVSHKQSVSPQINKEFNVAKKQCVATKDVVDSNTFEALLDKNEHQFDSGSPKYQISLLEVKNMLIQQHTCSKLGLSRIHLEVVDGYIGCFVVLTPSHSNNKVEAKSDKKSGTNIKSREDMKEEEKQASSPPMCSKLSPTSPVFVPSYAMVLPSLAVEQLVAQTTATLNAMDNPTKGFQARRYEPGGLVEDPMKTFEGDIVVDIFDEEDVDEVLDEFFAKMARDGDLSPREKRK
ncbi:hypothetical protein CQW23_17640 [Capsicum baccatum]|uniref:Uncharacterized protein n=1 Tax=Capsicum baccatum TaxID=33114 RepID=A0A2G2WEE8_CAPBA|nr:hypothetical protein CQW23_17640 [Capsicum baccatum]